MWIILLSFCFCLRWLYFFLFNFLCNFSFFLLPSFLCLVPSFCCCFTDAEIYFPRLVSLFLFIFETCFCSFISFLLFRLLTMFSQILWSLLRIWFPVLTFFPLFILPFDNLGLRHLKADFDPLPLTPWQIFISLPVCFAALIIWTMATKNQRKRDLPDMLKCKLSGQPEPWVQFNWASQIMGCSSKKVQVQVREKFVQQLEYFNVPSFLPNF